ncbi:MAG TPA: NifB/NifX family molybdenum-iron cluster-binding protein [Treponemataceae bacterium]|nr:NifB/NifX family molybdenum-iron cluster-binding protein [Treponemataceae bacterium]
MKIAVPVANGKLNLHFGHCAAFDVFDIAADGKSVAGKSSIDAPPHEPGLLPRFLGDNVGYNLIAGGMGSRAQSLFAERGITVCVGAECDTSDTVVARYLDGSLVTGTNACDH